jgi:hypothetical protein
MYDLLDVLFTQPPHSEGHHRFHNHAPTAYRSFSGMFCLPLMVLLLLLWCVSIFLDASFMQPFRATITLVGCNLLVCLLTGVWFSFQNQMTRGCIWLED